MLHQGPENPEYNEATSNHSFARLYALDCMYRRALQLHLKYCAGARMASAKLRWRTKDDNVDYANAFQSELGHRGGRDICVFREHGAARNPVEI
jgi:hypothetical protein